MSININSSSPILIAGMNSNIRSLIARVLNTLGYANVSMATTLELGLQRLETEEFSWIIMDLQWKEPVNGMNILKLLSETPDLYHIKVSLMVTDDEMLYLPRAFAYGVLSYHNPIVSENQMTLHFKELESLRRSFNQDGRLVAAWYLKSYLKKEGYLNDFLAFCQRLLQYAPTHPEALKMAAECYISRDENRKACSLLKQIETVDPLRAEEIQALKNIVLIDMSPDTYAQIKPFPLFKKALVILPASNERSDLIERLEQCGLEAVSFVEQEPIKNQLQNIDVIYLDWQQNLRCSSSYIKEFFACGKDIPLVGVFPEGTTFPEWTLDEMGFCTIMTKEIHLTKVAESLMYLSSTSGLKKPLKLRMIQAIFQNQLKAAEILKSEYLRSTPLTDGQRYLLEAQMAAQKKEFLRAKEFCVKALVLPTDERPVLSALGKALAATKDYRGAALCFQSIPAPDFKQFAQTFDQAGKLLSSKNQERNMDMHPALVSATGFMNAKGIAYMAQQKEDEGVDCFLSTLLALGNNRPELMCVVYFNLGLSFARAQYLREALAAFHRAQNTTNKALANKCTGLIANIEACLKNDQPYKADVIPDRITVDHLEKMIQASLRSDESDRHCADIYQNTQNPVDDEFMFKTTLSFKKRETLKRGVAMGLERLQKSS